MCMQQCYNDPEGHIVGASGKKKKERAQENNSSDKAEDKTDENGNYR